MTRTIQALFAVLAGVQSAAAQIQVIHMDDLAPQHQAAIAQAVHVRHYTLQQLAVPEADEDHLLIDVTLMGAPLTLELRRTSLRAPDFQVFTHDAAGQFNPVDVGPPRTYEGAIMDLPDSPAAGGMVAGGLRALVWLENNATWAIQPASDAGLDMPGMHIVYMVGDTLPTGHRCGNDDFHVPHHEFANEPGGQAGPDIGYYKLRLAFDADFHFYLQNGASISATVQDIESITAGMNVIYKRDAQICFQIASTIVRSDIMTNPYTTNDASSLLGQFINVWQANHQGLNYGLAHLMTGRDLDGTTIGIARVGTVCGSDRYGLSQSRYTGNYNARVALTAHEIGHNFGAGHCNQSETYCGYQPNDCRIMCSSTSGCSGNNTSFNSASVACIAQTRTRSCLQTCGCGEVIAICPTCPVNNITFPALTAPCGSILWITPATYNERPLLLTPLTLQNAFPALGPVRIGTP